MWDRFAGARAIQQADRSSERLTHRGHPALTVRSLLQEVFLGLHEAKHGSWHMLPETLSSGIKRILESRGFRKKENGQV